MCVLLSIPLHCRDSLSFRLRWLNYNWSLKHHNFSPFTLCSHLKTCRHLPLDIHLYVSLTASTDNSAWWAMMLFSWTLYLNRFSRNLPYLCKVENSFVSFCSAFIFSVWLISDSCGFCPLQWHCYWFWGSYFFRFSFQIILLALKCKMHRQPVPPHLVLSQSHAPEIHLCNILSLPLDLPAWTFKPDLYIFTISLAYNHLIFGCHQSRTWNEVCSIN